MKDPLACQSYLSPVLVSFPALSRIKQQAPSLVVLFRQFRLSFNLAIILPPRLKKLNDFSEGPEIVQLPKWQLPTPIPSRDSLRLGLRRCLIVFDPLTFVLDQRKHP